MAQKENQKENQSGQSEWIGTASLLNQLPAEFVATSRKRFESFASMQTEFFERFLKANKCWLDRAQAEASLASELASKLSSARSMPDAMTACHEWGGRRLEMMAEDAKRVMDDTQKFMQIGTHMLTNGFGSNSFGKIG